MAARPLTDYASEFRYPGDAFEPPREDVEQSLALAEKLVAAVGRVLGG